MKLKMMCQFTMRVSLNKVKITIVGNVEVKQEKRRTSEVSGTSYESAIVVEDIRLEDLIPRPFFPPPNWWSSWMK